MLLSRMAEDNNGTSGGHVYAGAKNQVYPEKLELEGNPKQDSQDIISQTNIDSDFAGYDVLLKNGQSSTGHKKNLSEHFDDALNITTGESPILDSATTKKLAPHTSDKEKQYSTVTATSDPHYYVANQDQLGAIPSSVGGDVHISVSPVVSKQQLHHIPAAGGASLQQYSYPPQPFQYPSSNSTAFFPAYSVPPPPPTLTPGSSDSRKHHRELSEHFPTAHRRKNTNGELENTKWSYADEDDDEIHVQESSPDAPLPFEHPYYPPGYYPHGGVFATQTYDVPSSHSDSGASYNMGSGPPISATYGHSLSLRASPNHEPFYSGHQYSYGRDRDENHYAAYITSMNAADGYDSDDPNAHHRHQSSMSGFLATPNLFEDVYREMEAEGGYNSAPDNIEENTIQSIAEPSLPSSEDAMYRHFYSVMCEDTNDPVLASEQQDFSGTCLQIGSQPPSSTTSLNPASKLVLKKQPSAEASKHRRKCAVETCMNRVVQGGLCISHGAKRKTCNFPGCNKNVKKQGKCSAHGPQRKRCEAEGCTKVAVQGGRCISHGAKKKGCGVEGCAKQSILGGMCKKHHDEYHGIVKVRATRKSKTTSKKNPRDGHIRGLSVFNDQETVDRIINSASPIINP